MKNNYEKGELAKDILKGLAVGGFIVACVAMPNLPQVLKLFGVIDSRGRYRFNRSLRNLQEKRLVRMYRKNGQDIIEITDKGKRKVYKYKLDEMKLKRPKKWDGMWHIVMFDIPEPKKIARMSLSKKVQEFGLYPLQKSVFVAPFPCRDEINLIGDFFNVREHIIYIEAHEVEGAKKMKQHFKL